MSSGLSPGENVSAQSRVAGEGPSVRLTPCSMKGFKLALLSTVVIQAAITVACLFAVNGLGEEIGSVRSSSEPPHPGAFLRSGFGDGQPSEVLPFSQVVISPRIARPKLLDIQYEVPSLFPESHSCESNAGAKAQEGESASPPTLLTNPTSSSTSGGGVHLRILSQNSPGQNRDSSTLPASYQPEAHRHEATARMGTRQAIPSETPREVWAVYVRPAEDDLSGESIPKNLEGHPCDICTETVQSGPHAENVCPNSDMGSLNFTFASADSPPEIKSTDATEVSPTSVKAPSPGQIGEREGDLQSHVMPSPPSPTEKGRDPIPLRPGPPSSGATEGHSPLGHPAPASPRHSSALSGSAAIVVMGLVLFSLAFVGWLAGRGKKLPFGILSTEVFEILGRASITPRFSVQLIRCGDRLLLVGITPDAINTLSEITDPEEVTRLVALCRGTSPKGISESFRQIFEQMTRSKNLSS